MEVFLFLKEGIMQLSSNLKGTRPNYVGRVVPSCVYESVVRLGTFLFPILKCSLKIPFLHNSGGDGENEIAQRRYQTIRE